MSKLYSIFFLTFTAIFMYFLTMPLREGAYLFIFILAFYKLLFKKVINHFKTGNFKWDNQDYIVYLLLFVMTLFIFFLGLVLRSSLPYFVEGLVATMWLGNLQPLGQITLNSKLANSISNLFFFSDSNPSAGNNSGSRSAQTSSPQSAVSSVNPSDSFVRPYGLTASGLVGVSLEGLQQERDSLANCHKIMSEATPGKPIYLFILNTKDQQYINYCIGDNPRSPYYSMQVSRPFNSAELRQGIIYRINSIDSYLAKNK